MQTKSAKIHDLVAPLLKARIKRSFREFAEQEITMPTGPFKGMKYRANRAIWSSYLLDMFDGNKYHRFMGSGPTQDGKTVHFFILPALYHLFEENADVILGVPNIDMAQAIFTDRLLPAIKETRYYKLMPDSGIGSRGGRFNDIHFKNGATLRFMGAGGGDAQRSSHTARIIILTEVDKMDEAGEKSRESDPVSQIEERAAMFKNFGTERIYAECTMSTEDGRIHREISSIGTDTKIYIPCMECGEYYYPTRELLGGWQGLENVYDARDSCYLTCPACGVQIDDKTRRESLKSPLYVSKGESIEKGKVVGDDFRTKTFGFQWNKVHSLMGSTEDIAEREWRAEFLDNEDEKKAVMQFVWALPWKEEGMESKLTKEDIFKKIGDVPRGYVPDNSQLTVLAIDLGKIVCWWTLYAFKSGMRGYLVDYGKIDVMHSRKSQDAKVQTLAILQALRNFKEEVIDVGWQSENGMVKPDMILVDSGYETNACYKFCKESGHPRYMPSKGLGTKLGDPAWKKPSDKKMSGNRWVISPEKKSRINIFEMHTDYWKVQTHEGFLADAELDGSLHLFRGEKKEHIIFARQICAEHQVVEQTPKGTRVYWEVKSRANHFLDTTYACLAGADCRGIKLIPKTATKRKAARSDRRDYNEGRLPDPRE